MALTLSLSGNTQELLSRGVGVNLERREPYDPILEASIGYAGATAVVVMDKVAFVNERQDDWMEGIEEGALSLVSRVVLVEEENRQLREVQRAQEERISRDGERIWDLERTTETLRTLINSLVETVGLVQTTWRGSITDLLTIRLTVGPSVERIRSRCWWSMKGG